MSSRTVSLILAVLAFSAGCSSNPDRNTEDSRSRKKPEPLPEHIKEQEKGLAETRDTDTFTAAETIPPATEAEVAEFERIWKHYSAGDPRWPLERDRFKARSRGAGYLLATYMVAYYMQLNVVRDRAGRRIVAVKNEIVAVGRPCTPFLVDMMILDSLEVTIEKKKRRLRVDDLTRQDCRDMLERMGSASMPQLRRALQRKDLGMKGRRMLALTMGGTRDRAALEPLSRLLRTDPSWQVRADAAIALGALGDKRAIAVLTEAIQKDADRFVVKKAGEARYLLQGGRRRG